MRVEPISDPDDPRLDDFRDLVDSDVRPDRRGIVIAEGVNVVERLANSSYGVRSVIGVPNRITTLAPALARHEDVSVYEVDKWVLSEVAGFRVTRGVLASARRPEPRSAADVLAGARRAAVLEGLNDFENLGSLFRNAAAFGIDAVLLDPTCADPLYRRSVRVSMGHVFAVPFAVLPGSWPTALETLRDSGLRTIALAPSAEQDLRDVPRSEPWAVLLGAEGPGLRVETLAWADVRARIPMAAGVDSLNVATAAAVAFAQLS